ncbi:MAG TPA: ABC transporter ATP-binding protein [Polyangiaceae bacterium LLY-WYZ-14_1]|nr:ABC transporter ATP-binding protein [Polyangiaceae bacterium LLY-WYZ-14_1]
MSRPLVEVASMTKVFEHEGHLVEVLRGIDLVIEAGDMACVVGPSGAGKSTLLHILGTLDRPTSGSIRFSGDDVTRYSSSRLADFRNRTLGFVFQFHHLLPEFTALENVMMPGLIRGAAGRRELARRASELLEHVELGHRLSHRPGELSGGEQQRVALARALVLEPRLVLADEPTGNLDSQTSDQIHDILFRLNEERGTTFLIVTHSRDLAERMPRVLRMRDGRIEADERREPAAPPAADDGTEAVAQPGGNGPTSSDGGDGQELPDPPDEVVPGEAAS